MSLSIYSTPCLRAIYLIRLLDHHDISLRCLDLLLVLPQGQNFSNSTLTLNLLNVFALKDWQLSNLVPAVCSTHQEVKILPQIWSHHTKYLWSSCKRWSPHQLLWLGQSGGQSVPPFSQKEAEARVRNLVVHRNVCTPEPAGALSNEATWMQSSGWKCVLLCSKTMEMII